MMREEIPYPMGWRKVMALSKGRYYWFHPKTEDSKEIKTFKTPECCKSAQPTGPSRQVQSMMKPPKPPVAFNKNLQQYVPKNTRVMNLKVNAFQIDSPISQMPIRYYEVRFTPELPTSDVALRKQIVEGTGRQRGVNRRKLFETFGYCAFDNHNLYAVGAVKKGVTKLDMGHKVYQVEFVQQPGYLLHEGDMEAEEGILNIFNRERLTHSGYTKLDRGWFHKTANLNKPSEGMVMKLGLRDWGRRGARDPNIMIWLGASCSIRMSGRRNDSGSGYKAYFCCDLASKVITYDSLHALINMLWVEMKNPSDEAFATECKKLYCGRHGLITYNKKKITIKDIDFTANENSTFDKMEGNRVRKITYKKYREEVYGLKSPMKEYCVVVDRHDCVYLPQHIRLTVMTSDLSKAGDPRGEELHRSTNHPAEKRLQWATKFVTSLNDQADEKQANQAAFRFVTEPESVRALALKPVQIAFTDKNKKQVVHSSKELKGRQWSKFGNFMGRPSKIQTWGIIYPQRCRDSAIGLKQNCMSYMTKRGWNPRNGPFGPPHMVEMADPFEFNSYQKYIDPQWQFALFVLPAGVGDEGSKCKVHMKRAIWRCNKQNKHNILLQCVDERTCFDLNSCIGVFENMHVKFGNVLYKVNPNLAYGTKFINWKKCWTFGLECSKNGSNKPYVFCLSGTTAPFDGSLGSWCHFVHYNMPRRDIIPYKNMTALFTKSLERCYKIIGQNPAYLPNVIWFFRGGVAEGQLRELYTKEVNGVELALEQFKTKYGLTKSKWDVKLEYTVAQRDIIDRFGEYQNGKVMQCRDPCVIFDPILSNRLWDAVMLLSTNVKARPVRYVWMKDGLKLAAGQGFVDAYQFIYSLTWCYAMSVPWPMGNCSAPHTLKYAKKYAETAAQIILPEDLDLINLPQVKNEETKGSGNTPQAQQPKAPLTQQTQGRGSPRGGFNQGRGQPQRGRGQPQPGRGQPVQGRGGFRQQQGRGGPLQGRGGPPQGRGGPPQGRGGRGWANRRQ